MSRGQLNHVKRAETSKAAWEELKRIHESKGSIRKATFYKQLYRMRKDLGITMNAYINNFTNKAEQLIETGIKIPDYLLSIMLLFSLPDDFENFSIAIESRDEISNMNSLKAKHWKRKRAKTNEREERIREKDRITTHYFLAYMFVTNKDI